MTDDINENLYDCDLEVTSRIMAHAPWEESPEIIPVEIKLVTSDDTVIGQVSGDIVSTFRVDPADLFEICDADSAGLSWACEALFPHGSNQLHQELNPNDEVVLRFLFIYRAAFLPFITAEHRMIFLHLVADRVIDGEGVVITGHDTFDLTPAQLAELGYYRIAGSDFVFCFASHTNAFSKAFDLHDGGIVVDLPPAAAEDFAAMWKEICNG